jgi:prepilin-type N-terminal cleavage/methylation domain-containing protein
MTRHAASRGFTLIEVLVAMLLTALVMTSVMGVLHDAINSRDHIHNISQIQRTGPMILDMIEADLRAIAPFDVAGRKVFLGKKNSIRGADADTMDFVVQRPASVDTIFSDGVLKSDRALTPPLCEVGYHLRQNKREPVFMELCRREDPLVDDDPYKGGTYTKIYDKITNFKITYFAEAGSSARSEDSWICEEREMLPQRVQIDLELEIEPRVEGNDRLQDLKLRRSFRRVFNLDADFNRILLANLRPRLPDPPKADDGSSGGPNVPGGPVAGGPGGAGGMGKGAGTGGVGTTITKQGPKPGDSGLFQNPKGGGPGLGGGKGGGGTIPGLPAPKK